MGDALHRSGASILSPLRYPGAKRRLCGFISAALRLNGLKPHLLVEPFAGSASVSLQLLNDGIVEKVALAERDPLVASFWKVVFFDSEWLIGRVRSINLTLQQWDRFKSSPGTTDRDRALSCLFLNRTSFSGILAPGAGPIGGRKQRSAYNLDCRFNVETLVKRIRQAAALGSRVLFADCASWDATLARVKALNLPSRDLLYYFDPPFYKNAERLYSYYFNEEDHQTLHDAIIGIRSPWILSYDPAEPIVTMYSDNGRKPRHVQLLYSVRGSSSPTEAQELVVSNLQRLPTKTRLWRSSEEWVRPRAAQRTVLPGPDASDPVP